MIEFFKQNYQWIFSGIGVSVLTILYFIIKGIIKRVKQKREASVIPETINDFNKKNFPETINIFNKNLLPKTIQEEIISLPPLQREQFAESYKGIKIKWTTMFVSAHPRSDGTAHIQLRDQSGYPWIFCDVIISEYPELRILKEGAIITVSGEIINVDRNTITIKPLKLQFN